MQLHAVLATTCGIADRAHQVCRGCRPRRRGGSAQGVLQPVDELDSGGAGIQAGRAAGDDSALPCPACSCAAALATACNTADRAHQVPRLPAALTRIQAP
ncbi:hypothetical protein [uncultured Stenotrophomonas sp.]|uniref:hypothetical protein n=1 Tax=uncultured Stenotrophomonas sp. TaxID=165438 RepID=UPI0025F14513|nr:hypothetical protein [uncultured Stenotrophomonas sp.]